MEKSDFDPRMLELAHDFAYAIMGGLAYSWNSVATMKANDEADAKWVEAQLLFLIHDCITMK